MADYTLTINMDAKCAECNKGGATACGLCMGCATKAMDPKRKMKSHAGRVVQARWRQQLTRNSQFHDQPKE